jgi:hypothetical protein
MDCQFLLQSENLNIVCQAIPGIPASMRESDLKSLGKGKNPRIPIVYDIVYDIQRKVELGDFAILIGSSSHYVPGARQVDPS